MANWLDGRSNEQLAAYGDLRIAKVKATGQTPTTLLDDVPRGSWPMGVKTIRGAFEDGSVPGVPTQFVSGYEELVLSVGPTLDNYWFDSASVEIPAVIAERETEHSAGAQGIDLFANRQARVEDYAKVLAQQQFLLGSVAAMSEFQTFNGQDYTTGLIAAAARGSQTNTRFNINTGNFQQVNGLQNWYYSGSNFSTDGLVLLSRAMVNLDTYVVDPPQKLVGYCHPSFLEHYNRSIPTAERYVKDGDVGKMVLTYAGGRVMFKPVPSSHLPTDWSCLMLDWRDFKFHVVNGKNWSWGPVRDLDRQNVKYRSLRVAGQLGWPTANDAERSMFNRHTLFKGLNTW